MELISIDDGMTIGQWFFLIGMGIMAVAAVVAFVMRKKYERIFGATVMPDDIADLRQNLGRCSFDIQFQDFRIEQRKKRHTLYARTYIQPNGKWSLKIETVDEQVVAYEARFESAHTWMLHGTYGRCIRSTYFIDLGA